MPETIRKTAARKDILQDFKTTHTNAMARGGVAASLAEQRLLPILKILASIQAQQEAAAAFAAQLLAALGVADRSADKAVGKVSDDIFLERVLTAVTRSAAIEIAQFKRMLKAHGFTETDAHTIIPDRSSAPAKKEAPAAPSPPATATTPVVSASATTEAPVVSPPEPDQNRT